VGLFDNRVIHLILEHARYSERCIWLVWFDKRFDVRNAIHNRR